MEQGREGIEELCLKFSDVVWGDNGLVTGAVKEDLPETGGPVVLRRGTHRRCVGLPDGQGGREGLSGGAYRPERISCGAAARQSIREQRMEALEAQALKQTRVERSTLGMQLAAS